MNRGYFSKDFLSGALFVLIGLAAICAAAYYPLGTPRRMGPGMFPILVGSLMVLIGGGGAVKALLAGRPGGLRSLDLHGIRPLAVILLAVGLFALLADRAGLVAGVLALTFTAQFAARDAKPLPALAVAIIITALVVPLFVWGLGVPFDLWPR